MMIFKQKIKFLAITICLFLFSSLNVKAANLSFNSSSSVRIGNKVEVILAIGDLGEDQVSGINGKLNFDSNYLEFVNAQNMAPFAIRYKSDVQLIAGFAIGDNIVNSSNLMKFTFQTKKEGTTTISLTNIKVTDANSTPIAINSPSKSITITPPPSTNANLSNLTISPGTINFNKNTTSYNIDVDSNITSIIVNASAEDAGAKVSGTGTKNLN